MEIVLLFTFIYTIYRTTFKLYLCVSGFLVHPVYFEQFFKDFLKITITIITLFK